MLALEEGEYKTAYNDLTQVRCVFEKALTNHQAKCRLSNHFCLADREGYSCLNAESSSKCKELLEKLRKNSLFVLKIHDVDGPLPHNMEIRVQAGGVRGLAKLLFNNSEQDMVEDINGVLLQVIENYGSLDKLPYSEIIQSIKQFKGRSRRQR